MATGGVRLSLERLQLTTHLAQQVLCTHETRLGAVEPTLGFLLALAVLQYAGCLLDDRPSILGTRIQHRIDLTLAHDDMLLATDSCVRQQFLYVEQSARHPVDRVFALTRTEERSGDGDLGELERQVTRGIVDRERDLGAPESRTLGGAGEDDIVHLLASYR